MLDNGRIEQYGFEKAEDERLKVYSANNAFLRSNNPSVQLVLETGLVIFLHASASRDQSVSRFVRQTCLCQNGK